MTKPVSRLEWFGNELDTLGIGAIWHGSGWDYTLYWGHLNEDGTPAKTYRSAFAGPARHRYPAPGEYTLLAVAELNKVQVSDKIVVRGERSPQFTVDDLGGGRIRLRLKGWPGTTLHQVIWGDASLPEDYTETQLAPEHTYPPGMDTALISVIDVPARRTATQTVHIDPAPPPTSVKLAWHGTGFIPSVGAGVGYVLGSIRGSAPPGTTLTVQMYSSDPDLHATADAHGHVQFPDVKWVAGSKEFYCPFRSAKAWLDERPGELLMWVPIYTRPDEAQDVIPVYTWDLGDPMVITLGVVNPKIGTYQIDWGDGAPVEPAASDGWALAVLHRYTRSTRMTIRVTDPDGKTGVRVIAGPFFRDPWVSDNSSHFWTRLATAIDVNDGDWYTPCYVDFGTDQPRFPPHLSHPTSPDDPPQQNALYEFYKEERGRNVTIRQYGPLRPVKETTMRVPHRGELRKLPPWPKGVTKTPANEDPLGLPLDAVWRWDTVTPGGYSGEITVTNTTGLRVASWRLLFQLSPPALVAQTWPDTAILRGLGDSSYAITSTTNLDPGASTTVGLRVEPAGTPPIEPTNLRAFPFVPTK